MSIRNGHARWAFDLSIWRPQLTELLQATACIQPEEKERLAKFVFRDDFNASLIGRLLMRKFIKETTGLPYNVIRFDRDARGRPYLHHHQEQQQHHPMKYALDFNISHQGDLSVLAGCISSLSDNKSTNPDATTTTTTSMRKPTIGVDVMKIEYTGGKPLHEFFRIMHRNFAPTEWSSIMGPSTELDQTELFMRHWCLKESYVKNIGVGITIDLQSINFSIKTQELNASHPVTDTQLEVDHKPVINWIFEESILKGDHCVAVALHEPTGGVVQQAAAIPFEMIEFGQLMDGSMPLLEVDRDYCLAVLSKQYKNE